MDALTHTERVSVCPNCNTEVPNEPSPRELNDMRHEARLRLLKAQKISYWKQFEHGMVSREAVRKLVELVDTAADIKDAFIETEEIKKTWQVKGFLTRVVSSHI
ncbi:hypothetical protein NP493_262g03041 [Ridgeia piscesae]|uniref:Uncharacterized protein n=1 Tax=Ridgeia piscesae TaxID=27915 RepID=A0AAD9NXW0_RIDPI|nr:hypothetical protein NP493_262g03041 [Ridgeia piscesae]